MEGDDVRLNVEQLLNQLQVASDKEEIARLCGALEELLLRYDNGRLGEDFLDDVCVLSVHRSPRAKGLLLSVLEASKRQLSEAATAALSSLLSSETSAAISKRSIIILGRVVKNPSSRDSALKLLPTISNILLHTRNNGLLLSAISFMEASATSEAVHALVARLETASPVATCAIAMSLGRLAKDHAVDVVPVLANVFPMIQKARGSWSSGEKESVRRSIKTPLITVGKLMRDYDDEDMVRMVREALVEVGASRKEIDNCLGVKKPIKRRREEEEEKEYKDKESKPEIKVEETEPPPPVKRRKMDQLMGYNIEKLVDDVLFNLSRLDEIHRPTLRSGDGGRQVFEAVVSTLVSNESSQKLLKHNKDRGMKQIVDPRRSKGDSLQYSAVPTDDDWDVDPLDAQDLEVNARKEAESVVLSTQEEAEEYDTGPINVEKDSSAQSMDVEEQSIGCVAFSSLLQMEKALAGTERKGILNNIIARTALSYEKYARMFLDHVNNSDENVDLAITAAFEVEWSKVENGQLYVMELVEHFGVDEEKLRIFVGEIPLVYDNLFDVAFNKGYVLLLKDIVLDRPNTNGKAISLLLRLCDEIGDDANVRMKAVQSVVGYIYGNDRVDDVIIDHAVNTLNSLMSLENEDEATLFQEVQRRTFLFYALVAKDNGLFSRLLELYPQCSESVRGGIRETVKTLIMSLGPSNRKIREIIADFPPEASELIMFFIENLSAHEGTGLPELADAVAEAFRTGKADCTFLLPVITHVRRSVLLEAVPGFLVLPDELRDSSLEKLHRVLNPTEILIAIHNIDLPREKIGIQVKAVDTCLGKFRSYYSKRTLASALHQMVDLPTIPTSYMRTMLQALELFPTLEGAAFVELSRLIDRQIWTNEILWIGFLQCVQKCKPRSFEVLLRLPVAQFGGVVKESPKLGNEILTYYGVDGIPPTHFSVLVEFGQGYEVDKFK